MDTAACRSLDVDSRRSPVSVNKSAQDVNQVTLLRHQRGKEKETQEETQEEGKG